MVGEDLGAKGLPEPSCVGFGFEPLDSLRMRSYVLRRVHLDLGGSGSLTFGRLASCKRSLHGARHLRPT